MVTTIKQGSTQKSMEKLLQKIFTKKKQKQVQTYKYCGVLKIKKDTLVLQKELRNEWE